MRKLQCYNDKGDRARKIIRGQCEGNDKKNQEGEMIKGKSEEHDKGTE